MSLFRNTRAILVVVLLLILFWPTSYLASPLWEVSVMDKQGAPLPGANVRLVYRNYSVESSDHELTLKTDASGRVVFPAVRRRATAIQRCFYTTLAATAGVHASFGRHAYVFVFGDHEGDIVENGYIYDWQGTPDSLHSKIVAK